MSCWYVSDLIFVFFDIFHAGFDFQFFNSFSSFNLFKILGFVVIAFANITMILYKILYTQLPVISCNIKTEIQIKANVE